MGRCDMFQVHHGTSKVIEMNEVLTLDNLDHDILRQRNDEHYHSVWTCCGKACSYNTPRQYIHKGVITCMLCISARVVIDHVMACAMDIGGPELQATVMRRLQEYNSPDVLETVQQNLDVYKGSMNIKYITFTCVI